MNASETYYKQEESKKFKEWTQGGLEFLLKNRTDVLTTSQIALIEKQLATFSSLTTKGHKTMNNEMLVAKLLKYQEVKFKHDSHFIYIQERSDGDYEGDIYYSQKEYKQDEGSIDGGICTTFIPDIAIDYFIELADDLTKRGL